MKHMKFSTTAILLSAAMLFNAAAVSAQSMDVKIGDDDKKEHKEEEKVEVKKEESSQSSSEKSAPSLEYELKRVFGAKSETSLQGPRIESLGAYFLDKYTGQVTLVSYHKGDPVRWNILRDNVPDDYVYDKDTVNYQLIRYGENSNHVILLNVNSGAMWAIDTKGFSYKKTRLIYIPVTDTIW